MSPVPQEKHLDRAAALKSYISTSQHFTTDFLVLKGFRRSCSNMQHAKLAVRIVSIWSRSRSWGQTQCTLSNLGFQNDCSDLCHQAMKGFALTAVYKHRHKGYLLHTIPFCCIFSCVLYIQQEQHQDAFLCKLLFLLTHLLKIFITGCFVLLLPYDWVRICYRMTFVWPQDCLHVTTIRASWCHFFL